MSDLSPEFAADLVDYLSQNIDLPAPPADLYITLFDDLGNELNTDVENGRVAVSTDTPAEWTVTNTAFENNVEVDFGEATADIDVQQAGFYDSDTGGTEFLRFDVTGAPTSINSGGRVFFTAGELSANAIDYDE